MATAFNRPGRQPLRISIDGRYIQDHFPGIGRYTYNLLRALTTAVADSEFLVLHNPHSLNTRHDLEALGALHNVRMLECVTWPLSPSDQWLLPAVLSSHRPDVIHTPHFLNPFRLPCPSVATVHDLIPLKHPDSLPSLYQRLMFRLALWLTCKTSSGILTPSEASRRDLIQFCSWPAEKVHLAPYGVDERFKPQSGSEIARVRCRYGLPERYALHLGGNKPHKNLGRLMEAWAQARGSGPEHDLEHTQLVIAGSQDNRFPDARQRARALGLARSVLFPGEIAETDLPGLYSGAALFLFPSLSEGFGLPVLEAMACGTAVVCSNASALAEVAGDAAITIDPTEIAALAQAIGLVLRDGNVREQLRRQGLTRAKAFSWNITAADTYRVYQNVAAR